MMRKFGVSPSDVGETMETMLSAFDPPTERMADITPSLYQSGYVTIKDYDSDMRIYTLAMPNEEIRTGLFESLLPNCLGSLNTNGGVAIAKMAQKIRLGDKKGRPSSHAPYTAPRRLATARYGWAASPADC